MDRPYRLHQMFSYCRLTLVIDSGSWRPDRDPAAPGWRPTNQQASIALTEIASPPVQSTQRTILLGVRGHHSGLSTHEALHVSGRTREGGYQVST